MKIYKARDYDDMSRKAAAILAAQVVLKPDLVLGLATGSSPVGAYRQLVEWHKKGDLDFERVSTVNLDEYLGLGPQDTQSYAYFMRTGLFSQVNIRMENTFIPDGLTQNVEMECAGYDATIKRLGGIDMQLLGLGANGHIGFNEPGEAFEKYTHCVQLSQSTISSNSRFFDTPEAVPQKAITMGIRSIMHARKILVVANGEHKAEIVKKAFFGPITPAVPASVLQLHQDVTLVADMAALSAI